MIWTREEYLSHMTFHGSPREMLCELFGPLKMLEDEWRAVGEREEEISLAAFGFDSVKYAAVPFHAYARTGLTGRVISDSDTETVSIDAMGRKTRLSKKCATIALPFSYPVETPEDWERVKHWYAFEDARVDTQALKRLRHAHDEGTLTVLFMPGGFDEPRGLMGEVNLCCAYYDEPEMVEDMMDTLGRLMVEGLERVMDIVPVDVISVHEDMAGLSGPMIGPKLFRQFVSPYYRRVWDTAKQGGAQLFSQDSDGNILPLIDEFLEAGINCIYPAEPKAGMDIRALREKYGTRLAFKGGLDKFALLKGPEAIDRELDYKLCAPLTGGGTVFGLDHRIPNGVTMENYRYYVNGARKRLGSGPCGNAPHVRMAF